MGHKARGSSPIWFPAKGNRKDSQLPSGKAHDLSLRTYFLAKCREIGFFIAAALRHHPGPNERMDNPRMLWRGDWRGEEKEQAK